MGQQIRTWVFSCQAVGLCILMIYGPSASLTESCGKSFQPSKWRSGQARIAGGFKAQLGQFPSYVNLRISQNFEGDSLACGGVVIDETTILTAAHCLTSVYRDIYIRDSNRTEIGVASRYCIASGFEGKLPTKSAPVINDFGVIKVKEPFIFNNILQPACLPLYDQIGFQQQAYTVGMGQTGANSNSDHLVALSVKRSYCDKNHLDKSVICFKDSGIARGQSCVGDSGGPVLANFDGSQTVVGITSHGPKSCDANYKGNVMYANVIGLKDEVDNLIDNCYL